jgi:predicted metal-dependent hydrolase
MAAISNCVRIAAPLRINDDTIRLFAISKISWIKRNQRRFEEQIRILLGSIRIEKAIVFREGDTCLILSK